ncbi:MAG: hypothetical protein IJN43_07025 [Ruminococcus sp.]|nr:hypothetical protein [Ruminococcus sp.]
MKNKIYKLLSIIVTILICVSIFTSIPTSAISRTKIFEYHNYIIDYSIIDEWDNHQNISIVVTNTSN